jgi:hypothetical protein
VGDKCEGATVLDARCGGTETAGEPYPGLPLGFPAAPPHRFTPFPAPVLVGESGDRIGVGEPRPGAEVDLSKSRREIETHAMVVGDVLSGLARAAEIAAEHSADGLGSEGTSGRRCLDRPHGVERRVGLTLETSL